MSNGEPAPLSDAELEAVVKTGTIKVTIPCPACAGTGWDATSFYRSCRACGATWDDINGDRSGTAAMEAWEKNPRHMETQPCGDGWEYHFERDQVVCCECEGGGTQLKRVPVAQLAGLLNGLAFEHILHEVDKRVRMNLRERNGLTDSK